MNERGSVSENRKKKEKKILLNNGVLVTYGR